MQRPQQQSQQRNDATIEFYNRVQDRCAIIARMPTSQHQAEIAKLADETGLTGATITPIIEQYAFQRVPGVALLATQFCERIGREKVRTLLATGYGNRELTRLVQDMLTDERLSITGPRVALLVDAIKAEFQTASPSKLII